MTKLLQAEPKIWLDLKLCRSIYDAFRTELEFSEPLKEFSTRYPRVLEGILGSVKQTFDGQLLFPTVLDVAVAYFYKINRQHPFENGNKRMCVLFTDTFLTLNGVELTLPYQDMYVLATFIADAASEKQHSPAVLHDLCREVIQDYCKKKS